jgi:excisionase family DNA binding protein
MLEPMLYTLPDASRLTGLGHTKLYELIGKGVLHARKAGSRTLITGESLRAYIAGLPKAEIRTGREAA